MTKESKQMIASSSSYADCYVPHSGDSWNAFLRSLRLQVFSQPLSWRKTSEKPKIAIFQNRWIAFLHATLHGVPLAASLTLMYLNIHGRFLGPMTPTALTALQFAAKVQEVLTQASLAAILLAVIRRQVLGRNGLPLGSFFAPSRAGDVSYLWSMELWGSLTSKCLRGWRRIFLSAFIPAIIVLTVIVGPSTAVLMIPRLKEYPHFHLLTMLDANDTIYPNSVNLENIELSDEKLQQHTMDQLVLGDVRGPYRFSDGNVTRQTLTDGPGEKSEMCIGYDFYSTLPSRTLSGMLQSNDEWEFGQGLVTTRSLQVMVASQCFPTSIVLPNQDLEAQFLDFFGCYPNYESWISAADVVQNMTDADGMYSFGWVGPPKSAAPPNSIILIQGSWSNMSVEDKGLNEFNLPPGNYTLGEIQACVLDAFWLKSTLNSTTPNDGAGFVFDKGQLWDNLPSTISISPQWAEKLTNVSKGYQQVLQEPLRLLAWALSDTIPTLNYSQTESWGEVTFHAKTIDGIDYLNETTFSRPQYNAMLRFIIDNRLYIKYRNIEFSMTKNWTDPDTLTLQDFTVFNFGYGYDASEFTVKVALGIVGSYCFIGVLFLGWLLVNGQTSCSWDSTSELFMLGLNSHYPTHLGNTSAGIESLKTLQEPVKIQFDEAEDSLQIVFANDLRSKDIMYDDVRVNKAY